MKLLTLVCLMLVVFAQTAIGSSIAGDSVVYIGCERADGTKTFGTGVIVNDDGSFITARHVVSDATSCKASLRSASFMPQKNVQITKQSIHFDAAYMSFITPVEKAFSPVCVRKLDVEMKGLPLAVWGFPARGTGEISTRSGVLSTISPDEFGLLETDAMTAQQMSGGPVSISKEMEIIGIIVGVNLDITATPQSYAILSVDRLIGIFDLTDCSELDRNAREREVFSNVLQSWGDLALDLNSFRIWQETLNNRVGIAMGIIDSMYATGCFRGGADILPPVGVDRSQYSVSKIRNRLSEFDRTLLDASSQECQKLLVLNDEINKEALLLLEGNRNVLEAYLDGMKNFPRMLQKSILSTNGSSRVSRVILQLRMDSMKKAEENLHIEIKSIDGRVLSKASIGNQENWESNSLHSIELELENRVKLENLILGSVSIANKDPRGVYINENLDFFISVSIVDDTGVRFTIMPFSTALSSHRLSGKAEFRLVL